MARTKEIPREQWASFLQMLARELTGRPVRIEVENRDIGDQEMARMQPLRDIGLETKGPERGSIELTVGSDQGELGHSIHDASRLYVQEGDTGEVECIAFEEAGGGKTLLFFEHPPLLPEQPAEEGGLAP